MPNRIVSLVVFGLFLGGMIGMAEHSEKEKAALATAEKWLAFVDAEKYAESWQEAAEYFRNAVKQKQWTCGFGWQIVSWALTASLPGAPDGVVCWFFAKKCLKLSLRCWGWGGELGTFVALKRIFGTRFFMLLLDGWDAAV